MFPLSSFKLYVSKVGSKILFLPNINSDDNSMPPILLYGGTEPLTLSKCEHIRTSKDISFSYVYYEMTPNDIDYLEKIGHAFVYYKK